MNFNPAALGSPENPPSPDINPMQAPMEMPPEAEEQEEGPTPRKLDKLLSSTNIAESLPKERLKEIGSDVYDGFIIDEKSKSQWDQHVDEWVKLAAQVREVKNFPWPDASNVKYPMLATAAMQFAARAYPSLVPADGKIVNFKVVGLDPGGMKAAKADKLAKHMNYQLLEDMCDWEEEMDKLLIQLPIVGCLFKKTYFDPLTKTNASKLLGVKDLVVNYWASSLENAYRKTEIIPMTKNMIRSNVVAGLYLDVDLGAPKSQPDLPTTANVHQNTAPGVVDPTTPYVILEQHTFLDLDDDGYAEPYIITIEKDSKMVLRIVARFDSDGIKMHEGKVVTIVPVEYYTKYGFIPNPDGGFYDIGFGHLLGPLNESANTLINLLVDAGKISNLQSGFIGKGLRLRAQDSIFAPGEWKNVNTSGDDIKKHVYPLPVREPSETLFKLLSLVVDSGKELASVAEIFTGKMPGQNTPATTTNASIEQGMKVFTAIFKRTYRSLTKEFKKLFRLNSLYEENFEKAQRILDAPISPEDYDRESYDVCPSSDPTAASTTQKQLKADGLAKLIPLGTINVMEATKRMLEAQEQPNVEALMQQPQPQPDPKAEQIKAEMQRDGQKAQLDAQMQERTMQLKEREADLDRRIKEWEAQMEMKARMFGQKMDQHDRLIESQMKSLKGHQELEHGQIKHDRQMAQNAEKHQVNLQQSREKASAKNSNKGNVG